MNNPTIGIALGGGGARGAAHIGVFQALHTGGLVPDLIAGTSAGAVIGGMYAATRDPFWIEMRFRELLEDDVFKHLGLDRMLADRNPNSVFGQVAKYIQNQMVIVTAMNKVAILKKEKLEAVIRFLLPVETFEELDIPLIVIATDFNCGEPITYTEGDLISAIVQSSSIPGFVSPTTIDSQLLLDGGTSTPIPVIACKERVNFTVAIDISRGKPRPLKKINMLEIMTRSERITSQKLCDTLTKEADFVIRPEVKGLHWSQFERFDELVTAGKVKGESNLDELFAAIAERKSWKYKIKKWMGNLV
ncbi:MAG: patatin-like phospholipase family protein [Fidelibacterota bacterium]